MAFYITGDVHGKAEKLIKIINEHRISKNDILAIVGDVGFNFFCDARDKWFKNRINKLNVPIFCVRGNHEKNPHLISTYRVKEWNGGNVFYEPEYPNLIFAIDGEIYNILGLFVFVCGGAYSVDKYYRAAHFYINHPDLISSFDLKTLIKIAQGSKGVSINAKTALDEFLDNVPADVFFRWFKEEQPTGIIKRKCLMALKNFPVDVILTHTAPLEYEPTEVFIKGLNQDYVDKSTEKYLSEINAVAEYRRWFAGHYHTDKDVNDKFTFLYNDVVKLL